MFFEEITEAEVSYKLKKISETLNTVHGIEIDFTTSVDDLQLTYEHFVSVRANCMNQNKFNGYFNDPEFSKSYLICEAIRIFLSEVAPTRKRKKRNQK